jgi:GAF domain-containing protein
MSDDPIHSIAQRLGLAEGRPEHEVLRLLIELCAQFVGAAEGSLLLLDREEDPPTSLVFAMTVGSGESEAALRGQRVPLGEGLVGLAAVSHEVQIGSPSYEGVEYAREGVVPAGEPASLIAAPMLAGDDLVGVVTAVTFDAARRFSEDDARLYARAAAVAGLILDQARRLQDPGAEGP